METTRSEIIKRANNNKLRVLVVDDQQFVCLAVQRMLLSLGVKEVLLANDGERALDILQYERPNAVDVVICDLDMPGMDGLGFLRHLALFHFFPLSIIIASGMDATLISSVGKMTQAYGLHLLGSIEKPLSLATLGEMLELHAERPETKLIFSPELAPNLYSVEEILEGVRLRQFEPFFQPEVSFKNNHVVSAELSVHWRHPKYGLISPYHFIGTLEKANKMAELTYLVLQHAATASIALRESKHDITIAAHLSLASLTDSALADKATAIVQSAGGDPNHIMLEISEATAMTEDARVLENLARLRMRGFGLSIDDYGAGLSNMLQLSRIPFDRLKMAASLVKDIPENQTTLFMLESNIEMAHKLHVVSLAKGVMSQQHWDILRDMDCDVAQGNFVARPMNFAALLDFCAGHQSII
ncbi:MAG: EAL domain-containing response regulator [Gallionella sp.]|nr:EAL domain-containing response regulator [Gallionella sp.]MDD4958219.1 EAL domain-containing response regulator [Gallionella sp.]